MQLPGERPPGSRLECPRCERSVDVTGNDHHRSRTLALALAAALLYPAAILLPVLTIEQFGQRHSASIWDGACKLLAQGELLVGGAILGFSIVLPALKLAGLVALSMPRFLKHRHQARTYHLVELTGRFGMLDVLLVALLVAVLKLGDMVTVLPGPGAATFTITVVLSLLASASFDPHAIWEES
jgi:paraquat-inducible protein A